MPAALALAAAPAPAPPQLADDALARCEELLVARTGMHIAPGRRRPLSVRLQRRIDRETLGNVETYLERLRRSTPSDPDWDALLQEAVARETCLFADAALVRWLADEFLPECGRRGAESGPVRIWSAGCGTGDDAATMACLAAAAAHHATAEAPDIRILGTELSIGLVEQAREGLFAEAQMRLVPAAFRRFFQQQGCAKVWQLAPELRSVLVFRRQGLLSPPRGGPFALIVAGDVIELFDEPARRRVLQNLVQALAPAGYLACRLAGAAADGPGLEQLKPWLCRRAR
jgi:chemotaxis protein methyltransferase CheR